MTKKDDPNGMPGDVARAVAELPEAEVLSANADGLPTFVRGELAKVGGSQYDDRVTAEAAMRPYLGQVLAPFRLSASDVALRKVNIDEEGNRHYKYNQKFNGLEVVGGDLVVHVDVKGAVYAVNGNARGDIPQALGKNPIGELQAVARIAQDARWSGMSATGQRVVYIITDDTKMHKAYETVIEGVRGQDPVRDKVYVDVDSGAIVAVYPQIYFAENRKVYTAKNGSSIPGTLVRSEGQAASTDIDVNAAYDGTGAAWEAYNKFFGRDSYDNAGAQLTSTVHYSTNYCNAYWNSTQMVYGDGNASQNCAPLARSVDVTAHELTHAVTENESALVYSGESGGMNEAMSDIFGAFVEAWVDGGKSGTTLKVTADTWLVGEDILPPALRYMCNPKQDGASKDLWTSTVGNSDVHYSSGVGNLAFCLLVNGGKHPRTGQAGVPAVTVPALGFEKAIRILYRAQVDYITSSAKYAAIRTSMETATTALGYDQATKDAVGCAWAAVAVGTIPAACGGTGPGPDPTPTDGVLTSGKPVTGVADAEDGEKGWTLDVPAGQSSVTFTISGGTGDADLYVKFGAKPTSTVYDCRPYKSGNVETCTFTPAQAGKYYVMLVGYSAYSGVTLTGTYGATTSGDPYLKNGTAVTGVAGATGSSTFYRVAAPANVTVTVRISGGTGDADLYTRFGSRPTTANYNCRPYLNGNSESCSYTGAAGDLYVMLRGYAKYAGLSVVASW